MDIGKRFDSVANRYDTPDKEERSKRFVQVLLEKIPVNKNFKVMDVGAGTGTVDIFLSPYVREIVALDLSEGMLDVFRQKIEKNGIQNIRIYRRDIFSEGFDEKDFDLIITSMTFHHLKEPEKALSQLKEYLKKGGYIAVIDLYKEDGTFHSDNTDVMHFGFDEKDVENWLKYADIKKYHYSIVYSIQKERNGTKKEYPVFLIIAIKK
ncbi:class I SAM-dependent methyltransferase [Persephonella sp.]